MPSFPSPILVHEFVTGGGCAGPHVPEALGAEALAMLRAVLADFRAWGRFPVLTTLDRRLRGAAVAADQVVVLDAAAYPDSLVGVMKRCGAALIIAPESGRTLERLSALVEDAGIPLLGSRPKAVAVAADKWECYRRFSRAGLPTPETVRTTAAGAMDAAEYLGFPLMLKPADGAGCEGVGFVPRADLLETALGQPALQQAEHLLVQRYVSGIPASVSLLVAEDRSMAVSVNRQWVRVGIPCEYRGGVASISHSRRAEALDLARRAVALVPGLLGYVGVDLVLGDDGCSLIEINPRLTTSYVGLRRVTDFNMAEAIWRACREGGLPAAAATTGQATFRKGRLHGR
jgi:predicted ATP-grasp superfamily ATP-dependent carboligase